MYPKKAPTLPSSKIDYHGNLVSEPGALNKLIGEEYGKVRLRKRPTHPLNIEGKKIRKILLTLKMEVAKNKITAPFAMKDLETVLKTLKANKSRDPEGIDRTIFGMNTVGNDLKLSLLMLFNNMKTSGIVPEFMRKATVTTIPKKGSKLI